MIEEIQTINDLRKQIRPKLGIGRIVGYLIFISYFTLLPATMKRIWPSLLQNFQISTIYVGSVFLINVGIFLIYNGTMFIIYSMKSSFFEQFKNTDKPWPWQENPQEWRKLLAKSIKFILINFFIVTPVMVYVSLLTSLPFQFSVSQWPSGVELISQFVLFLLVEDMLFYFSHRLLHKPQFYWIHKHHHEYRQTIGLAAHYVHPIEYVISGTIPSTMGFQILSFLYPVHYATVLVWLIYRMIQSYEGHCGYTWSWNTLSLFPYTVGSDYHDFHHAMNAGNFGSVFIFWDAYFHTESPFVKHLGKQLRAKQQKNKLK